MLNYGEIGLGWVGDPFEPSLLQSSLLPLFSPSSHPPKEEEEEEEEEGIGDEVPLMKKVKRKRKREKERERAVDVFFFLLRFLLFSLAGEFADILEGERGGRKKRPQNDQFSGFCAQH